MKPIVGVMPLWDDEKDSIWMLPGYMDGIHEAGALPFVFPFVEDEREIEQLMNMCDGFLFTGGQDVSSEIYGEEPLAGLVDCCRKRDIMEAVVLKKAIEADKPVLGICRGLQFMNAYLGGSLYQDLPSQHPSGTVHNQKAPYDTPVHEVNVMKESPLYELVQTEVLAVNSLHHQAVREVAKGLRVMAVSTDGLVEALYKPDQSFFWAVQWHPEFVYKSDESNRKIFGAFVKAMQEAEPAT